MWIPEIGFYNAKTGSLTPDDYAALVIRKDRPKLPFDYSRSKEDAVFDGSENALMYFQRFYAEYHCTFNLKMYPFEEQECKIEFKLRAATKEFVVLKPGNLKYSGEVEMVEYAFTHCYCVCMYM